MPDINFSPPQMLARKCVPTPTQVIPHTQEHTYAHACIHITIQQVYYHSLVGSPSHLEPDPSITNSQPDGASHAILSWLKPQLQMHRA